MNVRRETLENCNCLTFQRDERVKLHFSIALNFSRGSNHIVSVWCYACAPIGVDSREGGCSGENMGIYPGLEPYCCAVRIVDFSE